VATLAQIRQGIATVLNATDDRITVYPYWTSRLHLPAAVLIVGEADLRRTFSASFMEWPFRLYVLTSMGDPEFGQVDLDEYLDLSGSRSLFQALDTENLGYPNDVQVAVESVSDYGDFEAAGIEHVGAILNLTVRTKGP
jgi:hypothetical protein